MKSYTNIEQSKELAKILPIESADMCYRIVAYNSNDTHEYQPYCFSSTLESDIPCWSLAALLNLMQIDYKVEKTAFDQTNEFTYSIWADYFKINTNEYDELVDACYEMILKLKEEDLI